MRSLVLHGPRSMAVEQRPDPAPGSGEILVRITATGICGSDLHGYTGENGRRHAGQVMGHETVGRVHDGDPATLAAAGLTTGEVITVNPVLGCLDCQACGSGEEHVCPNRRVIGVDPTISAAFADFMVVPARNAIALPAGMPEEHGALVEPLSVGYHAARRGRCSPADAVLVLGGGPIGQACVLAARRCGVERIVVSEPDGQRRALASALGASTSDPGVDDVAVSSGRLLGRSATLVLDAVGSSATVLDALSASARGARVVLVGMNEPSVTLPAYELSTAERDLIGSFVYSREDFASTAVWAGGVSGDLERLVQGRVGWDGAAQAFADLACGAPSAGKVLVLPDRQEVLR